MIRVFIYDQGDKGRLVDLQVTKSFYSDTHLDMYPYKHIFVDMETRKIISSRDEFRMRVALALNNKILDLAE